MDRNKWIEHLLEIDKKHIWHPFTQMKDWVEDEEIIIIEKGEGCYLYDVYGRKFLDGVSSLWVNVHGHRKKEIDEAIRNQLDKIAHSTLLGLANVPSIELAERLIEITPEGLNKVFYSDNGSTAVEIGLKIAYQYFQQTGKPEKKKIISFVNAYHGDTIGSVSVGGIDLFHQIYKPLLFETVKIPYPYCYRCPYGKSPDTCNMECLTEAKEIIRHHRDDAAAIVIEPRIQGAAGMITAPDGFLKGIYEAAKENNILLIADEVATGFGRTGKMFAVEHEDVTPDIMAVAKGISGGYLPNAATLTTDEVYYGFYADYGEKKTFFHGHTYTGNPLAAAAAIANIDLFKKEKTIENLQPKIEHLRKRLQDFWKLKHVGDIRQAGFMVGIELVVDRDTKEEYPYEVRIGHRVIVRARKYGIIIRPLGNVIVLMPPLCISIEELDKLLDGVYMAIEEVTDEYDRGKIP